MEKRIKQDKKHPGVLIELKKSTAIWENAAELFFVEDNMEAFLCSLANFPDDYLDQNFKPQHGKYSGWTAQIIQHELDHVAGIVI